MKDTVVRGIFAGAIATPIQAGLNWIWFITGLTDSTITQLTARALLLIPAQQPLSPVQHVFGLIGHFIIGLLFAVFLSYIFWGTGFDFYLLKGAGFASLIWVFHLAVLPYLAGLPVMRPVLLATLHLADHLIWGLLIAYLLRVFYGAPAEEI